MEYRFLGRSGLKVSEMCLGATMTFYPESSPGTNRRILDAFADAGGNFFDTGDAYAGGASERFLGEWLAGRPRDAVVVATKVHFATERHANAEGLSRKHLLSAAEQSLQRLRTDHIDLYQMHCWDPGTPLDETLSALDSLVRSGKVRYLGASNFAGWQLQKTVDLARHAGWQPIVALQPLYNLLDRTTELELIPVCLGEGLGVLPWSPLRGGWLGGRFRRGMTAAPAGSKVADQEDGSFSQYANERTWRILDVLEQVAQQTDRTMAQVALRWLLQKPGVTAPVIGARTAAHLAGCLGALGWSLAPEQMAALDGASRIALPYPHDYIERSTCWRRPGR